MPPPRWTASWTASACRPSIAPIANARPPGSRTRTKAAASTSSAPNAIRPSSAHSSRRAPRDQIRHRPADRVDPVARTFPATRSSAPDPLAHIIYNGACPTSDDCAISKRRRATDAARRAARWCCSTPFRSTRACGRGSSALADTGWRMHRAAAPRIRRRRRRSAGRVDGRLRRRRHRSARRAARPAGGDRRSVDGRLRRVRAAASRGALRSGAGPRRHARRRPTRRKAVDGREQHAAARAATRGRRRSPTR